MARRSRSASRSSSRSPVRSRSGSRPSRRSGRPVDEPMSSSSSSSRGVVVESSVRGPSAEQLDRTVYVGELTRNVTEAHLREIFSHYGNVEYIWYPKYENCGLPSKPFTFIRYATVAEATVACAAFDHGQIDGLHVRATISTKAPVGRRREANLISDDESRAFAERKESAVSRDRDAQKLSGRQAAHRSYDDRRRDRRPSPVRKSYGDSRRRSSRSRSKSRSRSRSRSPAPADLKRAKKEVVSTSKSSRRVSRSRSRSRSTSVSSRQSRSRSRSASRSRSRSGSRSRSSRSVSRSSRSHSRSRSRSFSS